MQWLASLCIRQPVFTWVLMLSFVVVGIFGYTSLGVDQFPKVDLPTILITSTLEGSAPEEMETDVTDKIEGTINTISGVDELRSTSSDGVSLVIVTFDIGKDINVAAQEVRDHINNVTPDLPKGMDPPVVSKVDPDASPIMLVTLTSPGNLRDVTELADKRVRRQIESINGVGQLTILGGKKRQINVWLDPAQAARRPGSPPPTWRGRSRGRTSPSPADRSRPDRRASRSASKARSTRSSSSGASSCARRRITPPASGTWPGSRTAPRIRRPPPARTASPASSCRSASSRGRTPSPSST